jgi:hypothetical protein
MLTLGWLLGLSLKFWPKADPIALFYGVSIGAPNKGTNRGAAKTAGASLAWTRWKKLRQELGPWRLLPWQ